MEEPASPIEGPHSRVRSRTREEREAEEQQPLPDDLAKRVKALEERFANINGQNGVSWNDGVISLDDAASNASNPQAQSTISLYVVYNGNFAARTFYVV